MDMTDWTERYNTTMQIARDILAGKREPDERYTRDWAKQMTFHERYSMGPTKLGAIVRSDQ